MEKRLEYFGKVIKVVTELMDVTDQEILGKSKSIEAVDARWMAIQLLKEKGIPTKSIAARICHPVRTINHALAYFEDRFKYSNRGLLRTLAIARQMLGNNP